MKTKCSLQKISFVQICIQICAVFILLGCSVRTEHNYLQPDDQPVSADALKQLLTKPQIIDYSHVEKAVLKDSCIQCHNSTTHKDGIDLSNYQSILVPKEGRVLVKPFSAEESVLVDVLTAEGKRHMPPIDKPQLTADQKKLVSLWIANGANEKSGIVVNKPDPTLKELLKPYFEHPENIDYAIVKKYVFDTSCTKCHSALGATPDHDAISYYADLTTYATLFKEDLPAVVKGFPSQSELYKAVAVNQTMPPLDDGYDLLDVLRAKVLRLWILNCAIESKAALGEETLSPDPDNADHVRPCEPK